MKPTQLRIVQDDGTWTPTQNQAKLYSLWEALKAGKKTPDQVIEACRKFPQKMGDHMVTMTYGINMDLDLGDIEWGDLVAALSLHRAGCYGDCDGHDRAQNEGSDFYGLSVWTSKGKKYWILAQRGSTTDPWKIMFLYPHER
jgi:hypothetical protein